jgi:DNA-binding NtrC family response regulator
MVTSANEARRNNKTYRPVVLLVEDETLLRETTAEYLRLSGFTVVEAANAGEALAAFAAGESVDLVFSDVRLAAGTMDGFGLARWVHRHHGGVPVLLTSGHGEAIRAATLARESSFVAKPYRQKSLVSRLYRLLDEARGRTA